MIELESEYQTQLNEKVDRLSVLLRPFYQDTLSVFDSPNEHYRMRAEFRVWHDGDDLYHIMFDQKSKKPYRVDSFPAGSETINWLMNQLINEIKDNTELRFKLFQIDYLTGLSGEAVVSLLYHRQLGDKWLNEINLLKKRLSKDISINFIGRARKQKIAVSQDFIIEKLRIAGRDYEFKHIENSFTQPNAEVNIKMIEWVKKYASDKTSDLLEFYCGAGNFSIPLAQDFRSVVGTEIAKPSVAAAQYNIKINDIHNVKIVRLSAEEFVEALEGKREFKRLEKIDLSQYDFSTVLVDPPRSGLDDFTLKCIQRFNTIIYISCNPRSLVSNLEALCASHEITEAALFDQFPFTEHIEAGVILSKKQ